MELINRVGDDKKKAFRDGVYAPAIKLQIALGEEAIERGKARYEKAEKELSDFLKEFGGPPVGV